MERSAGRGRRSRASAGQRGLALELAQHLGGVLSLTLGQLLEDGYGKWRPVMDNCAVTELVVEPRPEILSFNLTDHLKGL